MLFYKDLTLKKVNWNLPFKIPTNLSNNLYERHYYNIEEIIPSDLLDRLDSVDLRPSYIRLFVWPVNHVGKWHIDGQTDIPQTNSMNWVLSGSGKIQWSRNVIPKLHTYEGAYLGVASSLDDEFEEETSGNGIFLDASIPHRVMTGSDGRTAISLQWKRKDYSLNFLTMVERFKEVDLII